MHKYLNISGVNSTVGIWGSKQFGLVYKSPGIPECKLNFYSGESEKVWVNVHTSHSKGVC